MFSSLFLKERHGGGDGVRNTAQRLKLQSNVTEFALETGIHSQPPEPAPAGFESAARGVYFLYTQSVLWTFSSFATSNHGPSLFLEYSLP